MSVLLDLLNGCNVIPVKVPANYYVDIHKLTLKFTWRGKKKKNPRIANTILKNKAGGLTATDFKTY